MGLSLRELSKLKLKYVKQYGGWDWGKFTESLGMPMFGGWPGEEPPHPPKLKKRIQGGNGNRAAAESLEEQMYKWQGSSASYTTAFGS